MDLESDYSNISSDDNGPRVDDSEEVHPIITCDDNYDIFSDYNSVDDSEEEKTTTTCDDNFDIFSDDNSVDDSEEEKTTETCNGAIASNDDDSDDNSVDDTEEEVKTIKACRPNGPREATKRPNSPIASNEIQTKKHRPEEGEGEDEDESPFTDSGTTAEMYLDISLHCHVCLRWTPRGRHRPAPTPGGRE